MGCCGSTEKARDWKPLEDRSCTDVPWLVLFALFNIGMLFICGFAISTGAASRLISGYDSYGNICGQRNAEIPGIELSGRDQTANNLSTIVCWTCVPLVSTQLLELAQVWRSSSGHGCVMVPSAPEL